jgi:hypothetical protein
MKPITPCERFQQIVLIDDDPNLSTRDQQFLNQHRKVCSVCKRFEIETQESRRAVLLSAVDHIGTPRSTQKIVAKYLKETSTNPITPLRLPVLGAVAAAVIMGVILQMVSPTPHQKLPVPNGTTQAPEITDTKKDLKLFEPDPGSTDLRRNDV